MDFKKEKPIAIKPHPLDMHYPNGFECEAETSVYLNQRKSHQEYVRITCALTDDLNGWRSFTARSYFSAYDNLYCNDFYAARFPDVHALVRTRNSYRVANRSKIRVAARA